MVVARNFDLVLLAIALPVFIVADIPVGGWLAAAGIWAMWRGVGVWSENKAMKAESTKDIVGITAGSMIGRGWIMGISLLVVGLLAGDDVGLSAAILSVILFTVSITARLIFRPLEGSGASTS